jgi:predicted component of type VI protein secretion system
MKAELVPENGDPPIPITRDVTVVGRREFCDVVIADASLSKRHCVMIKTDGLLVVRDLASTNGTKVKGQKIRWAALLPDDRLTLGSYRLRVYLGPDHAPAPSELARAGGGARRPAASPPAPSAVAASPAASRPTPPEAPVPVAPVGSWSIDELPEDDDSGWRDLLPPSGREDDDVVIELD